MDVEAIEQAEQQVPGRDRHARVGEMPVAFQLAVRAAHEHVGHVFVAMLIGVAHVAAVENQRMIQQRPVTVRSLGHPLDQMGQHLDVILVDLR